MSQFIVRTALPFLLLGSAVRGSVADVHRPHSKLANGTSIFDPTCTGNVTVYDTTTIIESKTQAVTQTHYVDVTVCLTESTTTTLHYTVNVTETTTCLETVTNTAADLATVTNTETDHATVTNTETDHATVTNTETDLATVTKTETDSATVTNTETTTNTVPATITSYTTKTVISTEVDPCPSTCSISAATVNLYFWPTNRPYTYPSTYVDTALAYTFTSPSVYMLIPTAAGTNSLGSTVGPVTSRWILPLDLEEVSTIVDGTVTRQLTLSDLGTDCPQTAEPSAIATMVDSRCDPILAAPKQVSSWANPCNACGRFGLFDPPYAVPTLTGGLVETTVVAVPITSTNAPPPPSPAPTTALVESSPAPPPPPPPSTPSSTAEAVPIPSSAPSTSSTTPISTPTVSTPNTLPSTSPASSPSTTPTPPVLTASAIRVARSSFPWVFSIVAVVAAMM